MSSFRCKLECIISKSDVKTEWSDFSFVNNICTKQKQLSVNATLWQQVAFMEHHYSVSLVTAVNKAALNSLFFYMQCNIQMQDE